MRNIHMRMCADLLRLVVNPSRECVCMCALAYVQMTYTRTCMARMNKQEKVVEKVVEKFVPVEVTVPGPPQIETKIVVREIEVPVEIKVRTSVCICT